VQRDTYFNTPYTSTLGVVVVFCRLLSLTHGGGCGGIFVNALSPTTVLCCMLLLCVPPCSLIPAERQGRGAYSQLCGHHVGGDVVRCVASSTCRASLMTICTHDRCAGAHVACAQLT
jgi:hypothetical protein